MLNTLTEVEVRRAKATGKAVKLFDGGCLGAIPCSFRHVEGYEPPSHLP